MQNMSSQLSTIIKHFELPLSKLCLTMLPLPLRLSVAVGILLLTSLSLFIAYRPAIIRAQLPGFPSSLGQAFSSITGLAPYLFHENLSDTVVVHQSSPYFRAAYATFLSAPLNSSALDGYFLGARTLTYSLLHDPKTRTTHNLPLLILVTPDVSSAHRNQLTADGATIVQVPHLHADWIKPGDARWRDVLAKLHLFNLISYRKICFLDSDTLVTGVLDGIFEDAGTESVATGSDASQILSDEAPLPSTYLFAAHAEALNFYAHDIPPPSHGYLNAGFFVLGPSTELFNYYTSLLEGPGANATGKFVGGYPEQDLLNYAHRWNGNMPWRELRNWRWNVNWPTRRDWEAGARSFHAKYWEEKGTGGHDDVLWEMWQVKRRAMERLLGVSS